MADIIVSSNMNLPVPTVSTDFGPDWATNLNACLSAIDGHDHTSGKGVAIPPSGLNINTSLPMNNNSLTGTKAVVFQAQSSLVTLQAAYVIGVDLYYNDGSGNVIRITQSGAVSGATGTITGLPSGTASAAYQSVPETFVFQSATNTPANIDGRNFILRNNAANSKGLTLSPPAAMGADITETLPSPPAATAFMTMSSAGAMGVTIPIALGITNSMIANGTIAFAKLVAPAYVNGNGSTGTTTTTTTVLLSTAVLVSTGRSVVVIMQNNSPGTGSGYFRIEDASLMSLVFAVDAVSVSDQRYGYFGFGDPFVIPLSSASVFIPSSSFTAGNSYTFTATMNSNVGGTVSAINYIMKVYEVA